jgi:general secretion pathway protein D
VLGTALLYGQEAGKQATPGAEITTGKITLVPLEESDPYRPQPHDPVLHKLEKQLGMSYLDSFVKPWERGNPNELIEFDFEDTDLITLIHYIEDRFGILFILDDILSPVPQGGKSVVGVKLSFRTNEPLHKKDAWALFTTFLDMAGFAAVPGPADNVYRISTIDPKAPRNASTEPLPTFIGVNPRFLPDNDTRIRYIYFVRNAALDTIKNIVDQLRSPSSPQLIPVPEVRGIIMTDKSYNIKSILEIVEELDRATMPESMTIVKLQNADATRVALFYQELTKGTGAGTEQQNLNERLMGVRRPQTLSYFQPGVRVIAEPRTNTVILLGPEGGVKKVEQFIKTNLDGKGSLAYCPVNVYPLKYIPADAAAKLLNDVIKFRETTEAAKAGGVRSGDKYLKPLQITPEAGGNRLIITGDYEDYLSLCDVLKQIDVEQPQVILRVLVMDVDLTDLRKFGIQLRNKDNLLLGPNINFQTATLAPVVENTAAGVTGAKRLLGDLVKIALGESVGSTVVTLGEDVYGCFGLLRMLQTFAHVDVITAPFLVTSNNQTAQLKVGEVRRIIKGKTVGVTTVTDYENKEATLTISLTPRVSYEGYISLNVSFSDEKFILNVDESLGNSITKTVQTSMVMANNEVAVLGGLIKDTSTETEDKPPFLSKIPVLGWLFKNKTKEFQQTSLLIFITAEVVNPQDNAGIEALTGEQLEKISTVMSTTKEHYQKIDPIHRWFFNDHIDKQDTLDDFICRKQRYLYDYQKAAKEAKPGVRASKKLGDFV